MKKIILLGSGGHCRSSIEVIESTNEFVIEGILDNELKPGENVLGYPVIGTDEDIPPFAKKDYCFLIAFGGINSQEPRKKMFEMINSIGGQLPNIISPLAKVSRHAKLGTGTIVMHGALINAGAVLGDNCIINSGSIIEHDVIIGSNCSIAPGAAINGKAVIGNGSFIGSNAVIIQSTNVCDNSLVGAGAVVVKDINKSGVYVGTPARKII